MDLPVVTKVSEHLENSQVGRGTLQPRHTTVIFLTWTQFLASRHPSARQLVPADDPTRPYDQRGASRRRGGMDFATSHTMSLPRHVMSHHVMSCDIMSHPVMSRQVMQFR